MTRIPEEKDPWFHYIIGPQYVDINHLPSVCWSRFLETDIGKAVVLFNRQSDERCIEDVKQTIFCSFQQQWDTK